MQATKRLPLYLEPELYERIERDALADERDPVQQVRWLLKRALADLPTDRSQAAVGRQT